MNTKRFLALYDHVAEAPGAIPRLRQYILNLAVGGKLVGQDANEEPASELLKRSLDAKAEQLDARKVKQGRNYETVSSEIFQYELPETWQLVAFENLVEFSAGRTPSRKDPSFWDAENYPWVSISDIDDGKTLIKTKESVSAKARNEVYKCAPTPIGTTIMSFKLSIGKIARLGIAAFHNEAIISIHPYLQELDPYLFKVLPNIARSGDVKAAIKGATLNRKSISNLLIPLPPLQEQHRIVDKVDELMALCDKLEEAQTGHEDKRVLLTRANSARLSTTKSDIDRFRSSAKFTINTFSKLTAKPDQVSQLRQVVTNLAIRGKLENQDPSDEPASEILRKIRLKKSGIIGMRRQIRKNRSERDDLNKLSSPVPPGWSITNLNEILIELKTGPFGSSLHKHDYKVGGVPVINPASIQNGEIIPIRNMSVGKETLERLSTFKLQSGDIVMGRRGEMGRCAVVTKKEQGWLCGTGSLILRVPVDAGLSSSYLALVIGSPQIREYLSQSSVGATMKNLNQSMLLRMNIAVPPFNEQLRILSKVNTLMSICDELETRLHATSNCRKSLFESLISISL